MRNVENVTEKLTNSSQLGFSRWSWHIWPKWFSDIWLKVDWRNKGKWGCWTRQSWHVFQKKFNGRWGGNRLLGWGEGSVSLNTLRNGRVIIFCVPGAQKMSITGSEKAEVRGVRLKRKRNNKARKTRYRVIARYGQRQRSVLVWKQMFETREKVKTKEGVFFPLSMYFLYLPQSRNKLFVEWTIEWWNVYVLEVGDYW